MALLSTEALKQTFTQIFSVHPVLVKKFKSEVFSPKRIIFVMMKFSHVPTNKSSNSYVSFHGSQK